ncbi:MULTISPECIES: hypothetical protein [Rhodococcus]|uniref:Uncharacterized protein n=1 Tax=Rhodococcus oxybenzonivorans TaxID=1990687 RepID=A0AAE5A5L0_9NOCA|nr:MULTISPECIES: hypothetical protein [Rhodococcus]MDV7244820.1 hypothetical protein [Rhodococcus oxybenzonivorans]MDV7263619.1 hypothetical protein [Rhodococcus oxybenzonivorans]MDV7275681.1 hypothetical protein [Rhodococcus oxybenzonivorans]MDV7332458.1 hypothetical protein [Rhodococcus oxybenzonivorans]MDV7346254.1 hypothetical protein [Rhodococcus oxybenzonivorans]
MVVGFDYWQVISHYPEYFRELADMHRSAGHDVVIISAVGDRTAGTVERDVRTLGFSTAIPVYEVRFDHPRQAPELKLDKCRELRVSVFYDDRDDVCRMMNAHGILALRVTRRDGSTYDLGSERG